MRYSWSCKASVMCLLSCIAGCSNQQPTANRLESTSIEAISDFHTRLNQVCVTHALQAQYAGPLGYSGREIAMGMPLEHLGTWVIAPEVTSGIPEELYRLILSPTPPHGNDFVMVHLLEKAFYARMEIAVPGKDISVQGMNPADPLSLVRETNAVIVKSRQ